MFTAVVLDASCSTKLKLELKSKLDVETLGYAFNTSRYTLSHHMTINMGPFDANLNSEIVNRAYCRLTIDRFCFDHELGVVAARVSAATTIRNAEDGEWMEVPIHSVNVHPHITMCLKDGVTPKTSNFLDWLDNAKIIEFAEPMEVYGYILESR